ncbi:metalloproteinase inhibitor 2-like [Syngnathus acus]|uniref:metalloproteinase inhibitor 2-like n=1 Tax=Syngnathus acus TaxID=161584 RepID=UPI0018861FAE|nr:metalloproteinase inhibitor 2-like [Syngnathus acus]
MIWTVKSFVLLCLWLLQEGAHACTCGAAHPQQALCHADVVIKAKVVGVMDDGDIFTPIKYNIKQTKMFKGPNKNFDVIYTPSLCGVTLSKGIDYLISGRVKSNHTLHVNLCNFLEPWDKLTAAQRSNLVHRYEMGCGCKITYCTSVPCAISSPAECLWTDYLTEGVVFGSQSRHFACVKRNDGSCAWYRGAEYPKKKFMDIEEP